MDCLPGITVKKHRKDQGSVVFGALSAKRLKTLRRVAITELDAGFIPMSLGLSALQKQKYLKS